MQTVKVSVIICASCINYRKKSTSYMETFITVSLIIQR